MKHRKMRKIKPFLRLKASVERELQQAQENGISRFSPEAFALLNLFDFLVATHAKKLQKGRIQSWIH
jgi:hypothetical protein